MQFQRLAIAIGALLSLAAPSVVFAADASFWSDIDAPAKADADSGRTVALDVGALRRFVDLESARGASLALPLPEGGFAEFVLEDSGTLPPELAAKYPEIRSLKGIDADGNQVRIDISPIGFQAMVFAHDGGIWLVQPQDLEANAASPSKLGFDTGVHVYRSVRRAALGSNGFQCGVDGTHRHDDALQAPKSGAAIDTVTGSQRRTLRVAIAATGEYTAVFGGTVSAGLAAITTALNRVNQVYERDFNVRMTLVPNNNLIVYTNASTDPYSNGNGVTMLGQNQTNLTSQIGSANYDIGHVFSTGGGGVAGLGVICSSGSKARGVTGQSNPVGDPFYIDYVAHEMGHQFGGNHTFNSSTGSCGGGNRAASSAYETGSGATIMAYAGICGSDDLQPNSDAYFHARSLDEISARLAATTCGTSSAAPNTAPVIAPLNTAYVIPAKTPFELTASATDADGDALSYTWEEYDLGASTAVGVDNGTSPIARSFNPSSSGTRTIPRLSNLLANTTAKGEILPQVNRTALKFRVTVRDNHAGGGASVSADLPAIRVVATSAPFAVTAPNTALAWTRNASATVTWNVGGTTAAPISCAAVDIALSTNGGNTFTATLASNVANNGSRSITVPNTATSQARVRVKCRNSIFFDVSNVNFSIN